MEDWMILPQFRSQPINSPPEVCEGTFFETEIEYETVALSKPEIEARPRRDRGQDFFLIPWSFRGKIEEFLRHSTFFETNIKDETRL